MRIIAVIAAVLIASFLAGCASVKDAYNNEIILGTATTQVTALAKAGTITPSQHVALNASIHSAQTAITAEFAAAKAGGWSSATAASTAASALESFLSQLAQYTELSQ